MEYRFFNKLKAEQTADPKKYPQGYFKPKSCKNCGNEFLPKAPSEHYCSDNCKNRGHTTAYLMRNYKITLSDYERMHEDQGGLCKICGGEGFVMASHHKLKLVVDHCHETSVVRGLLCHNCNRGLGLFQDNVSFLNNAIEYLKVQRLSERSTPEAYAGGSAQPLEGG